MGISTILCRRSLLHLAVVFMLVSCGNNESEEVDPGNGPRLPEKPVTFVNANLVYYGADSGVTTSDFYKLSFYTDMQLDEFNNPVGPGSLLRLSINSEVFAEEATDFSLPVGTYQASTANYIFDPWTFNAGFLDMKDLPTGKIEIPDGTFFGELANGTTEFTPDLLDGGFFKVERDGDVYTITGTLSGDNCLKRNFVYKGKLPAVDRSQGGANVPNSNLTANVDFAPVKARLQDKGDSFFLGDESIRVFNLYFGSSDLNLTPLWPEGDGQALKVEFFVAWDTDVEKGIPAGTYTVAPRHETGGIERQYLVPGNIAPGTPDRFTYPNGAWYQVFTSSQMTGYGRIDSGTMTVTRDGEAHHISFDFVDCDATTPHHIRGEYSAQSPITVYE